jgi:hypothetical protein
MLKTIFKKNLIFIISFILSSLFIIFHFYSCGTKDLTAPAGTDIYLTISPRELVADEKSTATIEAMLLDDSGPVVDGTVVYFFTNLGEITKKAETKDGIAFATLKSGLIPGTAEITVVSGSLKDTLSIPFYDEHGEKIFISANPGEITADTTAYSNIDVLLLDSRGKPVKDGIEVYFNTSLGEIEKVALTNNGRASAKLYGSIKEGTASVTAVSGSLSDSVNVSIGIRAHRVSVNANPATFITATLGLQTFGSLIRAVVWDAMGYPIPNKPIILSTDRGSFSSGGGILKTDLSGAVSDSLVFSVNVTQNTSEMITVTGTSGDVSGYINIIVYYSK